MLRAATFALICALLPGCGGVSRYAVYQPLGPRPPDPAAAFGSERDAGWFLELGSVEVHIAPVVVSEKLIWVIGPLVAFPTFWEEEVRREGPLRIGVFVRAKRGASVAFDPGEFTLIFEDGRSLSPAGIAPQLSSSSEAERAGAVTLSEGQTWRGFLQYDARLTDLGPFDLLLRTLSVNGQPVDIPPISFVRGRMYWSS